MTPQNQGIAGVVLAQTVLGTLGLCVLQADASPLSVAFYRCLIAALGLGIYAALRGDLVGLLRLPGRVLLLAILSGFLMVGNWVLFFEAIRRSGISVATIVFHVQPFLMVLVSALLFRERLRAVTFLWFGLALIGLAFATGITDLSGMAGGGSAIDGIGIAAAVAAAFLYALVTIIAKRLPRSGGLQLTLIQCLCGSVVLAPWLSLTPEDVTGEQWKWFATIGLVHTGAVYIMLYNALPKLPIAVAAVLLFLYPVSAIIVDAAWFRHPISLMQVAGFFCVLLASLGTTLEWGGRKSC
ncbi:DMT family transporter [Sinirhodobacter populi]|uniref:DMT family transporter n=1 Tax=Paenirhodobacter populi TaxID=2306993 RepID=A0A443JYU0_9RHOB|nr:DMT family transporter [Sinirhodobacter populi]RWR25692.1 DMT family transporter [Sinirhodobacter populi]